MHGRQCRRKPTLKANARRHSVHAHVLTNKKRKINKNNKIKNIKMRTLKEQEIKIKSGFWGGYAAPKSNGGTAAVFVYTLKIL